MDSRRRLAYLAFALAVLVGVGAVVGNVVTRSHTADSPTVGNLPATAVTAQTDDCVRPPSTIAAGARVFAVTNASINPLSITLAAPSGTVYGEIEALAPGTTRTLQASLGGGRYRFRCYFSQVPAVDSVDFEVIGAATSAPAVVPVSAQDLTVPTQIYERWVGGRLPVLAAAVRTLAAASTIADQRAAWMRAHHLYETLGAAYDAFGDYDAKINDDGFAGIEEALWATDPTIPTALEATLIGDVDGLIGEFPSLAIDPLQIGLRAHEITENTIEFTLTGRDDHGAHASLDTAAANLAGTQQVLGVLHGILTTRYTQLSATEAALSHAQQLVTRLSATYAGRPLAAMSIGDREQLNAAFGGLVELLAPIAAITDIRRTN